MPGIGPAPPIKPVKDAGRSPYWMSGRGPSAARRPSGPAIGHSGRAPHRAAGVLDVGGAIGLACGELSIGSGAMIFPAARRSSPGWMTAGRRSWLWAGAPG